LDTLTFDSVHGGFDAGSFEREAGDDVGDVVDGGCGDGECCEPIAGGTGAGIVVAAGEFPVGDIVQERGELDDEEIGLFLAGDGEGDVADSLDVEPIVAGTFAREQPPHMIGGFLYDVALVQLQFSAIHGTPRRAFPPGIIKWLRKRNRLAKITIKR